MAIVTEKYGTRSDGTVLIHTWSDEGKKLIRDEELYEEAIDPANMCRVYTESDEYIEGQEVPAEQALAELVEALNG